VDSKDARAALAFPSLRGGLIVSCQAEGDDPFNNPEGIALFARAASMGGAVGIRARQPENISAVKAVVDLPVIGITKGEFEDGSVLITADFEDVESVVRAGADIVAIDVTRRMRPNGLDGPGFLREVRSRRSLALMADVSTMEEGLAAAEAGADFVGPTLHGYTPYTAESGESGPNWRLVKEMCSGLPVPVIMEGGIWTPDQARRALDLGAFAVVVGTAITRPRVISAAFVDAMKRTPRDSA
jgi:N-acylglucosamine-6-phosphate 2-epimerase